MAEKSDLDAHVATYQGVTTLLKWGTLAALVAAAVIIALIHH